MASPVKPPSVRKPPEPSKILSVKSPPVTKPPEPTKVPSANPPALPLRKPLPTQSPTPPSGEQSSEPGVGQGAEAKFKAAQTKAKLSGVHTLTQKDIEGLSYEQIKELRGY